MVAAKVGVVSKRPRTGASRQGTSNGSAPAAWCRVQQTNRTRYRVLSVGASLAVLATACGAATLFESQAHALTAAESQAPLNVTVVLVGLPDLPSFPDRLHSLFETGTVLNIEIQPTLDPDRILRSRDGTSAEAWIALRDDRVARIYFVVSTELGSDQRFLVRDVVLKGGLDELGKEQVAAVVHSSIVALREGELRTGRAEIERELGSRVRPHEPRTRSAEAGTAARGPRHERQTRHGRNPSPAGRDWEIAAGLGYGANWRGGEPPAHGVQASLSVLKSSADPRIGAFLSARHLLRSSVDASTLTLTLDGVRFRAGPALRSRLAANLAVEIGLGGGIDWVRYAASGRGTVVAIRGSDELRGAASAYSGLSYQLAPLAVMLLAEVDVALQNTHYDIVTPAGRDTVLKAAPFQPGLSLLLLWTSP